jgi:hypothetical protein
LHRVNPPKIGSTGTKSTRTPISDWIVAISCIFFFAAGRAFIPHLGLQNDEALFGYAIYEPRAGLFMVQFLGARLPLMLMSYLGTLKGWIYRQIFRAVRPGLSSIRVPMVLAGVGTIWLFAQLLRRISDSRAAAIGAMLLASDALFLLTLSFDWGPVALQHLLLVGGMLLVVKFFQDRSERALCGGFFLFGLGLWDKALMIWLLGGMAFAAVVVFPRRIRDAFTPPRAAAVVLAFVVGALPLIVYNAANNWETFRGNAALDFSDIRGKAHLLVSCFAGDALFGWLVAEDHETPAPRQPSNLLERASFQLSGRTGQPRHNLMIIAFFAALLLAPLASAGERRAILFAGIAMAVAWGQMAVTRNAGGSAHHAVLLWPFPQMIIAISFAGASRRLGRYGVPVLAIALVLILVPNLLVMNQYYVQEIRNGGGINWNDSIVPLAVYIRDVSASNVFCVDWGILDSIRLLNRGRTPVRVGSDPISKPELSAADREAVHDWIKDPDHVFLAHTAGNEFFQGNNAKLVALAAGMGYRQEVMKVISDRFGRAFFEVYRFRRAEETEPPQSSSRQRAGS